MSRTITIRVPDELAAWIEETARRTGLSQGRIVRDEIEKARAAGKRQGFLRLSGAVAGASDLSIRKGFSRK